MHKTILRLLSVATSSLDPYSLCEGCGLQDHLRFAQDYSQWLQVLQLLQLFYTHILCQQPVCECVCECVCVCMVGEGDVL